MKKIILPIEIENDQQPVIDYTIQLALKLHMQVEMISVVNIVYQGVPYASGIDYMTTPDASLDIENQKKEASETFLQNLKLKLQTQYNELPEITTRVEFGYDEEIIDLQTHNNDVGLVIFTATTDQMLFDIFNPSANALIDKAGCPVLIIPQDYHYKPIQKTIYATDYRQADIASLQYLTRYIKPYKSHIKAVHVTDDASFKEQLQHEGFQNEVHEKVGYQPIEHVILTGDNIADELQHYAEAENADLIAFWKENRGFIEKLLHNSPIKQFVNRPQIPVLIFHA
ncbi:MAG: universal stress protein [Bacteroidetes bacterium]|jgi:nucleotide-binding universal stress UspA family protein|nr:universal stress protein [Bacteroidota bacterium]